MVFEDEAQALLIVLNFKAENTRYYCLYMIYSIILIIIIPFYTYYITILHLIIYYSILKRRHTQEVGAMEHKHYRNED